MPTLGGRPLLLAHNGAQHLTSPLTHLLSKHKGLAVDVDDRLLSHVDPQRMDALGGVGARGA